MADSKNQRVGIFVDVQNLYHTSKNLYKSRVNYSVLLKSLVRNRQLIRALAYVVKSDAATGEAAFFEALESAGLELRVKDLQIFPGGAKKGDWDVGMAVDAIRMAAGLDVVILVTGDGDFVPLVEYLKWGGGKFVEVAAFKETTSGRLQEAAENFTDLRVIKGILLKR